MARFNRLVAEANKMVSAISAPKPVKANLPANHLAHVHAAITAPNPALKRGRELK